MQIVDQHHDTDILVSVQRLPFEPQAVTLVILWCNSRQFNLRAGIDVSS